MNAVADLFASTRALDAAVHAALDELAVAAAAAARAYSSAERREVWGAGDHARTERAARAVQLIDAVRRDLARVERLVAADAAEAVTALAEWEA